MASSSSWLDFTPLRLPSLTDRRQLMAAVGQQLTQLQQSALHVQQQLQAKQRLTTAAKRPRGTPRQPQIVPKPLINLHFRVWNMQYGNKAADKLTTPQQVFDLFQRDGMDGRLLIIAEAGAGKTQTMLALGQFLLKAAATDGPVPVLLDVSGWQGESFREWVIDQLWLHYRISQTCGRHWIDTAQLTLLVDGFDVLPTATQRACARALDTLLRTNMHQTMALCCSRHTIERTGINFSQFNGGIHIIPLAAQQVKDYVTGLDRADVWTGIKSSKVLQQLARFPLLLNMIVAVYESELRPVTNQNDLIERYVSTQLIDLARDYRGMKRSQVQHYLSWLAHQLAERDRTFYFEFLNPSWLPSTQGILYRLLMVLLLVGVVGLISGSPLLGLAVGLPASQIDVDSLPRYRLSLAAIGSRSWLPTLISALVASLLLALLFGGLAGSIAGPFGLGSRWASIGTAVGLTAGWLLGVIGQCIGGLQRSIQVRRFPNQDTVVAFRNVFLLLLLLGMLLSAGLATVSTVTGEGLETLVNSSALRNMVAIAIAFGLWVSHGLQYFVLRGLLLLSRGLPLGAQSFLAAASRHHLLKKYGGGYQFIHEQVREQVGKETVG